nr:N-6 DNA methylase [Virgibacillus proomii]
MFRGASEGKIRKQIIEMNLLEAVIGLPGGLFYGTGIPACILVFKKNRKHNDVLFIDASGEEHYEKGTNQNKLREKDIEEIINTYEEWKEKEKYSYVASMDEIKENDYNLNIPRYVDTFEEEVPVDMDSVKSDIANIQYELQKVEAQMEKYLKELGL